MTAALSAAPALAPRDDPCYHQECDTIADLSSTALDQMSDAAAHAAWTLTRSESGPTTGRSATTATRALKFKGPFRVR